VDNLKQPSTRQEPEWGGGPEFDTATGHTAVKPHRESLVQSAVEALALRKSDEARFKVASLDGLRDRTAVTSVTPNLDIRAQTGVQVGHAIEAPSIPALESYENLKANLWIRHPEKSMKVILLVGATNGCGVSTSAANFAASLAQDSSARVLLVDANVRSPRQVIFASTNPRDGNTVISLERLLNDTSALQNPVGTTNLYALGAKCSLPLSVFRSEAFDEFLQKVQEFFNYIIVDAPPLASHPETLLLSRKADGVILVIESEKTRKHAALWAKKQIETAGGKLLGVVLNKRRHRIPNWLYKRI
jgi:capsular exopolysaccharide synthesis family protein